jgi:hypothetical protein
VFEMMTTLHDDDFFASVDSTFDVFDDSNVIVLSEHAHQKKNQ